MEKNEEGGLRGITSTEVLAIVGFALYNAWMLICFFWLFCEFPSDLSVEQRDLSQLFVFVGLALGYVLLHVMAKRSTFNLFSNWPKALEVVGACLMPLAALLMAFGVYIPYPLSFVCSLGAGLAAAGVNVSWLDVSSRMRSGSYGLVNGLALFAGGLLYALVAFLPNTSQPVFAMVYIVLSVVLLIFVSPRIEGNDERAPLESTADNWRFTMEIEPSFFMFGVVFALTFVFLFNSGSDAVALGLISSLVGALAVSILSLADKQLGITAYQRILVFVTVFACVMLPLMDNLGHGKIACSCVVAASWGMFICVNNAYLAKKAALDNEAPFFRVAPLRLFVCAFGFAVGWFFATCIGLAFGAHSEVFQFLRPIVAVLLVGVVMVFLPVKEHHAPDGTVLNSGYANAVTTTVITVDKTQQEMFEARCAAIAKLYQLSPRETEVLGYLAKGRNAAYIQEALVVSPHTVKSHIYNVYRKLDIHSQQKLMDFVEDYPLDS